MAKRSRKMTDEDIAKAIGNQIDDARSYYGADREGHREWALKFFEGEVDIEPMGQGRSRVVSRDVADTHGLILPGLLRVFFASSRIVTFEPTRPEHEAYADLASDLVNYVVMSECEGYKQFRSAMADGLLLGNGIIKHWWDDRPDYALDTYTGVSEDAYRLIESELSDDDEIIDVETVEDPDFQAPTVEDLAGIAAQMGIDPATLTQEVLDAVLPPPPQVYDFKVRRLLAKGRLRLAAIPPEEFWIERAATNLDETVRFCAHVQRKTRSELIKEGYPRGKVDRIPLSEDIDRDRERMARDDREWMPSAAADNATSRVDIYECYALLDTDGDGIAERRRIVVGGQSGAHTILANEEWGDDLPFSDLVPEPVPHRWRGRGLYDEMGDIQRVNTVLLRGVLDNTYKKLVPQRYAWLNTVENPDELVNPTWGGTVWLRPGATTPPVDVPSDFIVPQILPVIEYMNSVGEKRTGVSMRSQALDLDALQNQSATAVNAAQSAAFSKVEEYARNIAECGGMRRIFASCLKLITKHQDRAKAVRISGKFVDIDPTTWHNPDMLVTINTGLGTGSRERDLTILSGIAGKQEALITQGGPLNPKMNIGHLVDTYQKMAEAGGLRNPEHFFPKITQEEVTQMRTEQEEAAQGQPQQDPQLMALQARMQLDREKAQAEIETERAKLQARLQGEAEERLIKREAALQESAYADAMRRDEAAVRIEFMREENAAKLESIRAEKEMRLAIMREQAALRHDLRQQELALEAGIAAARADANVVPTDNIRSPE